VRRVSINIASGRENVVPVVTEALFRFGVDSPC